MTATPPTIPDPIYDEVSSESDGAGLSDTEDEETDKEGAHLQGEVERMTDEQIARLLSKQEELGMGSDELLLFEHGPEADEDVDSDAIPFMFSSGVKSLSDRLSRSSRGGAQRPPAAISDVYGGFDVMDFERPSLKPRPKARRGKLELDLSDSELEASMQMAWENSRLKKRQRKQAREELRAQGLLGSKDGKPDLKQKYKEGMGIQAARKEIRDFLMSEKTT